MTQESNIHLADRFNFQWVARCTYDTSDKIWGWFFYNDPTQSSRIERRATPNHCYVFYAATGKTPSFKRHVYGSLNMKKLQRQKIDRKYKQISTKELIDLWPNLYEDLNNKFIFHLLVNET